MMKIRFGTEEARLEAEVRDLSTMGTFVVSADPPPADERFELLVADECIPLSGAVVRITAEGFAIAFHALTPSTLDRLDAAIRGKDLPQPRGEVRKPAEPPSPAPIELAGLDWQPPVSEPVLHEWRPDTGFAIPLPPRSATRPWADLPTVAPTIDQQSPEPLRPPAAAPVAPPAAAPAAPPESARPPASPAPAAPSGPEQRTTERHERSIPISFDNLTGLIKEFTHNISYGGMFVYTATPLPKHTDTAVTLIHPVHGERLTLLARVVHGSQAPSADPRTGEARYGVGLEFKLPLDELKRMLADFIGSHQKQEPTTPATRIVREARAIMERGTSAPHVILGVEQGAGADKVRQAYFKLVDRFHPDRYFGKVSKEDRKLLEELFRSLTKAYEELTA